MDAVGGGGNGDSQEAKGTIDGLTLIKEGKVYIDGGKLYVDQAFVNSLFARTSPHRTISAEAAGRVNRHQSEG